MRKTIGTTAVQLDTTVDAGELVVIRNASADILLGPSTVTRASNDATDGWPYKTTDQPMVFRVPSTGIYARIDAASGTATLEVLQLGL